MAERGVNPIPLQQMKRYDVNRAGAVEGIWQPQYDFQVYALAGQTSLIFFQVPQGQGGKTRDDTNLEIAGSLPAPKEFLITTVQIAFAPGNSVAQGNIDPAVTPQPLSNWNDVQAVGESGHLVLFVGSKEYLID